MKKWTDAVYIGLCTSFGLGYSPVAPGTVGTLPAVIIFVLVIETQPAHLHTILLGAALLVSCVLSVPLGSWAEVHWQKKDPKPFVLDEVAGFLLTVLLFRGGPNLVLTTIWAFVATRAFDIIKPPPARRMESIRGGWGILLDDLVCSLYAAAFLHVVYLVFPRLFTL